MTQDATIWRPGAMPSQIAGATMALMAGLGTGPASAQEALEVAVDPALHERVPEEYLDGFTGVYDPQYPPGYFIDENGEMVGYAIDFHKAIAAKLGIPYKAEAAKFAAIITGIMGGRYDSSYFQDTPERREMMDMVALLRSGSSIMVQAGNPTEVDLNELCGHTIGVVTGGKQALDLLPALQADCESAGEEDIDALNFAGLSEVSLAVKTGRVEGWLGDAPNAAYLVRQQPEIFAVAPTADLTGWSAFAFRKGDPLAQLVKEATEQLIADGTYEEIIEGWHMKELALDTPLLNGE